MAKFCFVSMSKELADVLANEKENSEVTKRIEEVFSSYQGNDVEKKSALDQAARDYLKVYLFTEVSAALKNENYPSTTCNGSNNEDFKSNLKAFIALIIDLSKGKYCTNNLPILLLSDVFETLTLEECEEMFNFVEEHVKTWTSEPFFSTGKNHLLRMCNDILRRLSKSQNTVFCGRIQLFLAQLFPIEEKSALNLNSIFHVENITIYRKNCSELLDDISSDGVEEGELVATTPVDYNLYVKFWSLQEFFRNPPQTFTSAGFRAFKSGIQEVLKVFESQKIEFNMKRRKSSSNEAMDVTKNEAENDPHNYFAKYLTNEKLLNLQINDSSFRRYFLVQVLILFQYLNGTVKFKTAQQVLSDSQTNWVNDMTERIYTTLNETPPNGNQFATSVKHILMREENWINWKNESCPSFARVQSKSEPVKETQRKKGPKRSIGEEYLHNRQTKRINMGSHELTRLWNLHPDNLESCKAENRLKFLPSLEDFFEEAIEQSDPEAGIEEKYKLVKQPNFQWRSLRLLARRSHHFFTPSTPPFKALPDYLNSVIESIAKDKQKTTNDGKVEKIEIKEEPEDGIVAS